MPAPLESAKPVIWIHAVSVGETLATRSIVSQLQIDWPQYQILITTMTPTGADTARKIFDGRVSHRYIPYDLNWAVDSFINIIKPHCLVIMETEIWPNLIVSAAGKKIPVVFANARLSGKSRKRYRLARSLVRNVLNRAEMIATQTRADKDRFIELGVNQEKLTVMGNLKFDNVMMFGEKANDFIEFSPRRPVWIAASTHPGEEEEILRAHKIVVQREPAALLILVPRHPERAMSLAKIIGRVGLTHQYKSRVKQPSDSVQVFVVDTLGELINYYACADIAFVGGSLVPVGGHNILEPAMMGKPVVIGPYYENFQDIIQQYIRAEAITVVKSGKDLADTVVTWLANENLRNQIGLRGKAVITENCGSTKYLMQILAPCLR